MKKASEDAAGNGRILFILNVTNFVTGMWAAALGPALPFLARSLSISLDEAGALFTADSLGFLLCVSVVGRALDLGNRQIIFLCSLALMTASIVLLPQAPILPVAFGLVFLVGLGEGTLVTGSSVVGGDLQPKRQAAAINTMQAFYAGGALVAPLLVGYAANAWGDIRYAFWVLGLLLATGTIGLKLVPIPPSSRSAPTAGLPWHSLLSKRPFWFLLGFVFLYVGIGVGFAGWIFSYVRYGLGASDAWAAATTSVFWAALGLGRLISARLLRRIPAQELLVIASLGTIMGASFLMIGRTPLLTFLGTLALGLFYSPLIPTAMGIGHADHPRSAGTAIGLLNAASAVGWMTIPWLEGKLLVLGGSWALMAATLTANTLLFVLALMVRREWKSNG